MSHISSRQRGGQVAAIRYSSAGNAGDRPPRYDTSDFVARGTSHCLVPASRGMAPALRYNRRCIPSVGQARQILPPHYDTIVLVTHPLCRAGSPEPAPALRYNRNIAPTADHSTSNRNPNSGLQPLPSQEILHRPAAGSRRGNRLRPRIPP